MRVIRLPLFAMAATTLFALVISIRTSGAIEPKNNSVDAQPSSASSPGGSSVIGIPRHARPVSWTTFSACERSAKAGNPDAEAQLGFMYQTGSGVEASAEKALHWYQLASASGQLRAKVNMAVMYAWGMGVARDVAMAAQLFREAAEKGDGAAAAYLGDMYFLGRGVSKDAIQAELWYVRGAKLHDPMSTYNLALLETGEYGHARNLEKAVSHLKKSVKAGYVPAIYELGLLYVRVPQLGDAGTARHLLETASEAGYWRSSVVMALLYRDGKFVPANQSRAYYYFRLAALQGGDKARQLIANDTQRLEQRLSPDDTSSAGAQADAWHRDHNRTFSFIDKKGNGWAVYPPPMLADEKEETHAQRPAALPPA